MQKSEVLELLDKIDAHVASHHPKRKFELKLIGKGALILAGMTDSRETADLDSLRIEGDTATEETQAVTASLEKEFGRDRIAIHSYYLEFVRPAIVLLPQPPTWLPVEGSWTHLSVSRLDQQMLIAAKLFSAFTTPPRRKDKQDIVAALDQGLADFETVIRIADQIFDYYRDFDARSERFPAVYRFIQDELIPRYGEVNLSYQPEDDR